MTKTNAMRILDREGVIYSVHSYEGGALSGVQVAKVLGEDEDSVFKTLVTAAAPAGTTCSSYPSPPNST